jgi:hypothetical protein
MPTKEWTTEQLAKLETTAPSPGNINRKFRIHDKIGEQNLHIFGTTRHGKVQHGILDKDHSPYEQPDRARPSRREWQYGQVSRIGFNSEYSEKLKEKAILEGYKEYAILSGGKHQLYGENIEGWIFKDNFGIRWLIQLKDLPADSLRLVNVGGVGNSLYVSYKITRFGVIDTANKDLSEYKTKAKYESFNGTLLISDLGFQNMYFDTGTALSGGMPGGSPVPWFYDSKWYECDRIGNTIILCYKVIPGEYISFATVDTKKDGSQAILMVFKSITGSWVSEWDLFQSQLNLDVLPMSFIGINCKSGDKKGNPPVLSSTILRDIHQTVGDFRCDYFPGTEYDNLFTINTTCGGYPGTINIYVGGENADYSNESYINGTKNKLVSLFYDENNELTEVRLDNYFEKKQEIRSVESSGNTLPLQITVSVFYYYNHIQKLYCKDFSTKVEIREEVDVTTYASIECSSGENSSQIIATTYKTGYDHFTIKVDGEDTGVLLGMEYVPEESTQEIYTEQEDWRGYIVIDAPSMPNGCENASTVYGRCVFDDIGYQFIRVFSDKYVLFNYFPGTTYEEAYFYNGAWHIDAALIPMIKRYSYNTFGLSVGIAPYWGLLPQDLIGMDINTCREYTYWDFNYYFNSLICNWTGPSHMIVYGNGLTPHGVLLEEHIKKPALPIVNFLERYGSYNPFAKIEDPIDKKVSLGDNSPTCFV